MVLTKKDLKFLEDKSFELIKKADRMILEGFQKDKTIKRKINQPGISFNSIE